MRITYDPNKRAWTPAHRNLDFEEEYEELPELTDEMLARGVWKRGGRPFSPNAKKPITLRLPAIVIEKWKATGPGWQTRMAARLSKVR